MLHDSFFSDQTNVFFFSEILIQKMQKERFIEAFKSLKTIEKNSSKDLGILNTSKYSAMGFVCAYLAMQDKENGKSVRHKSKSVERAKTSMESKRAKLPRRAPLSCLKNERQNSFSSFITSLKTPVKKPKREAPSSFSNTATEKAKQARRQPKSFESKKKVEPLAFYNNTEEERKTQQPSCKTEHDRNKMNPFLQPKYNNSTKKSPFNMEQVRESPFNKKQVLKAQNNTNK